MRLPLALTALLAAALTGAQRRTAPIYIQPITSPETPPAPLAEIRYELLPAADTAAATEPEAEVTAYEAPELPDSATLVRVGVWDGGAWASSVSVARADNFGRGFAPHFTVTVGGDGGVLGAAVRGVRIDAGQTREFGPQAKVVVTAQGKQPELNKPVVLSPEGKKVAPPEEKSFLQKYWWVLAIGVFLFMSGGGGDGK